MSNVIKITNLPQLIGPPLASDYLILQGDTATYRISVNDFFTKWDEQKLSDNEAITSISSDNPGIYVRRNGNDVTLSNHGVLTLSAGDGITLSSSSGNILVSATTSSYQTLNAATIQGLPRNAGAYDYNALISADYCHILFAGNTKSMGLSQTRVGSCTFNIIDPSGDMTDKRTYNWSCVYNGHQYWAGLTTENRIFLGGLWAQGNGKGDTPEYIYFDVAESISRVELGTNPRNIFVPFHTRGNFATMFIIGYNTELYGFGHNPYGWLATNSTAPKATATSLGISGARDVAAKGGTVLVLQSNGQIKAAGYGANGEMGDGGRAPTNSTWHTVQSDTNKYPLTNVSTIAIESADTGASCFAVDTSNALWAWGTNTYGQLGNNTTSELTRATVVANNVHKVYTGGGDFPSTYYVTTDQLKLYACGYNGYGQLGNGLDDGIRRSFMNVFDASNYDSTIATVACGGTNKFTTTLVLLENGRLFAAGYMPGAKGLGDHRGWLEVNPPFDYKNNAKTVDVAFNGVSNEYTMFAVSSDGNVAIAGFNRSLKLGSTVLPDQWIPSWTLIK